MKELLEHVISDQEQLTEVNWRAMAGGALIAANLIAGAPGSAEARPTHTYVTQAEKKIDVDKLLYAIKQIESSGGVDTRSRHEPGVEKQLKKRYNILKKNTKAAIDKYGYAKIATSYGPYQVMASTAYDLGYKGNLESLKQEIVSKELARKNIQWLINRSKTKTVKDVVSAYNAGLGRIGTNPEYIKKVMGHYGRKEHD